MRQRGDEPEIGAGGGEIDVTARLVGLGFERKPQGVSLVPRVLAQVVERLAKALDGFDRLFAGLHFSTLATTLDH